MKKAFAAVLAGSAILASGPTLARELQVEITNLTNGIYFTPPLVAVHNGETHLFEVGTAASVHLQAAAEGGDTSGLAADVEAAGGVYDADPAGGLIGPGDTAATVMEVSFIRKEQRYLSIVGMLLPTNDGFVGLDGVKLPNRGSYTYYLNGYDAGTEANDEIINGGGAPGAAGIPADPGGNSGTGATGAAGADFNDMVHVHRGILGDTDPMGGTSDLDSSVHRWLNPVARVVVTIK